MSEHDFQHVADLVTAIQTYATNLDTVAEDLKKRALVAKQFSVETKKYAMLLSTFGSLRQEIFTLANGETMMTPERILSEAKKVVDIKALIEKKKQVGSITEVKNAILAHDLETYNENVSDQRKCIKRIKMDIKEAKVQKKLLE